MLLLLLRLFVCLFLRKVVNPKIIVSALKQNYLTIKRPAFVSDEPLSFLLCDVVYFVLFVGE